MAELKPVYPTLAEAEAAAVAAGTAVMAGKFKSSEEIKAAWICVGYGFGVGLGEPGAVGNKALAALVPGTNQSLAGLTWLTLVLRLLAMLSALGQTGP